MNYELVCEVHCRNMLQTGWFKGDRINVVLLLVVAIVVIGSHSIVS
jgi:hypothetical protein